MKVLIVSVALASVLGVASAQAQTSAPLGVWLTQDRDAQVRIASCGDALCGTIIWVKDPIDPATGRPETDKHNPDPAKRSRPLVGTPIMLGMRPSGPGRWSGHFYNTRDGRTYHGNLIVAGDASVRAEGCMLICMGETWQRVETTAKPAGPAGKQRGRS